MNEFKNYHPAVNFLYFTAVIAFSMFLLNPLCITISLACGFAYSIMLNGAKAVKFNLLFLLPMLFMAALINPAFNHQGATILAYLPSGNPLTLESVLYGIAAAAMIASVICWFSCSNKIITSDKIIYLFGHLIPSMSLLLSMTLRFVPRFKSQITEIMRAQTYMGRGIYEGNALNRVKNAISALSIMITRALENSIETADSMKSRGYGLEGRTSFSIFAFEKRDRKLIMCIGAMCVYIIIGFVSGKMSFTYFPYIKYTLDAYTVSVFFAYALLCAVPIITEITEDRKWKSAKSKI